MVHYPPIMPYILKSISYINNILSGYPSVLPDIRSQTNIGHRDLYFSDLTLYPEELFGV